MNIMENETLKRLRQQRDLLISRFINGRVPDFTQRHAGLLDEYFRESYAKSCVGPRLAASKNPYAVIALGGYGRGEQCVHSDIDLLFLFKKAVPKDAEALVREMLYPLWDLGLEIGHSTFSSRECLKSAAADYEILTPLLDARFICGMSNLYTDLKADLKKRVIDRYSSRILTWLVDFNQARHAQFGDSSYLLEPNLKEGQGGLRDYHTMLWIARIRSHLNQARDLEYDGYLSYEEFQQLSGAVSFIWKVRNRLHYLLNRKCDQLYFENQITLADELKYRPAGGQQPVERFLGDLHARMEFIKRQYLIFVNEYGPKMIAGRKKKRFLKTSVKGLEVDRGMLDFLSPGDILARPLLLVEIFEESARLNIPLSAEARRLVKEFTYLVKRPYRTSPEVIASFERILVTPAPTFNVLNEMLNTGMLTRLIPEMKGIVNRIQYDEYHLYPVDKHSLRTVHTLKSFALTPESVFNPLCKTLYKQLKYKRVLLWAALLHDIGKSDAENDHSRSGSQMVAKAMAARGLTAPEIETVVFLVKEHLLLIKAATRRDIHDEETAITCARQVKKVSRLKMLYLLTVADSIATGPKAWSEWTSTLLRDLFLSVLRILETGELATLQAVQKVEAKKEQMIAAAATGDDRRQVTALMELMSPRYLLYTPVRDMRAHIGLYQSLKDAPFVWRVDAGPETNTRTVTICAKDAPGLFSKIAGVFTLNRLDILDAKVYTWRNNIALDIFTVKPPPDQIFEDQKWEQARQKLDDALGGRLDLPKALGEMVQVYRADRNHVSSRPNKIVIDNDSSSFFTLVEVFAYDFPGLLFCITDALFRCRLDIWVAKIATKVDQVVDVFYVRDFDGQKIDSPDQISAIKEAVTGVFCPARP